MFDNFGMGEFFFLAFLTTAGQPPDLWHCMPASQPPPGDHNLCSLSVIQLFSFSDRNRADRGEVDCGIKQERSLEQRSFPGTTWPPDRCYGKRNGRQHDGSSLPLP